MFVAKGGWNGWIDILQKLISIVSIFWRHGSQTLVELVDSPIFFLEKSIFKIYVCSKSLLNGWIDIPWRIISLVSIFWRHTSQTLVELVDSWRFAKSFLKRLFFQNMCFAEADWMVDLDTLINYFCSQNLILRGLNFQLYVFVKMWLNGWI